MAHWIEKGESHDERLSSERAEEYPLLCMSNHPRWRMHAQGDDITWTREIPTMKVTGPDGYQYEPVWLNPAEAEARGIEHGDIVKIFNERGTVLGGAYVTERLMPGVAYMDHGARWDPIIPGKLDRGGAINTITPHKVTSKNATGMVVSGFLVEVAKVTDEEMAGWRRDYPGGLQPGLRRRDGRVPVRLAHSNKERSTMAKAFVIDVASAAVATTASWPAKTSTSDNDWTPYAKPQPDTGQFWMKIQENVCGTVPKVKMHYIPLLCKHCDEAPCIAACPDGAIAKRDDGLVLIEPEKCTGCKACVTACPYGVIYFNDELNLAQKCTGCAHLLDNGYTLPRCVEACPTDAMHVRRGRGPQGPHRGRDRASSPRPAAVPGSTTATSRASSSPARSTTRSRRKSSSAPAAC